MSAPRYLFWMLSLALAMGCTSHALETNASLIEVSPDLVVHADTYDIRIARVGLSFVIIRNEKSIFESSGGKDAIHCLQFQFDGKQQRVTTLRSEKTTLASRVLVYDTTVTDVQARVELRPARDRLQVVVQLLGGPPDVAPSIAIKLSPSGSWFGKGFSQRTSANNGAENNTHPKETEEWFYADSSSQGTPVWFTTSGVALWVRTPSDFKYRITSGSAGKQDGLFWMTAPGASALEVDLLIDKDVRAAVRDFIHAVGYPNQTPLQDYIRLPIYTTWVEFKNEINQEKVLQYAQLITKHLLPCGVIEIDDRWESHYGDLGFDLSKFPDPAAMVDQLHRLGYKVTLWVHPFVARDSLFFEAHEADGVLLRNRSGRAALIKWWNPPFAAILDLTNPAAAQEFQSKLTTLQQLYGVDGFKFDGGDVTFVTPDSVPYRNITSAEYMDVYNAIGPALYPYSESRVGAYSQPLGIVQRLIDKDSTWEGSNGLATVIPGAIETSMRGFPFLMPDIVGGNQYGDKLIDKELLVRWAQATTLMPITQYSLGPWHFGDEAVKQIAKICELHERFTPYIYALAVHSRSDGEPIIRPLWFIDPADRRTYGLDDEYGVGKDVIVAPVLVKGAVRRDIYLPAGSWRSLQTHKVVQGNRWLNGYPADLNTLPIFVRQGSTIDIDTAVQ